MRELFQKRRQEFLLRCLKYARYVFNDHFVLVLLVFIGFLSLQYRQLLLHFPENPWSVYLLLAIVSLLLFFAGNTATYLEAADQQFLLTKEKEMIQLVQSAAYRSFFIWGLIQLIVQLLLFPLYLKLGMPIWGFALYLLVLTIGKYVFIQSRQAAYQKNGIFQWELAIADEARRKQLILQFFALFTTVKGITTSVKRRAFLDSWLKLVPKEHQRTWDYLYLRAFLRSGDFLGLTVRLFALSLLSLVTIDIAWLAAGLVVVLDYLLLFQLLPLYSLYRYQYLSQLYPIRRENKAKSFQRIVRTVLYGLLFVQLLAAAIFLNEKYYLLLILGGGLFLNQFYLAIKAKKLID